MSWLVSRGFPVTGSDRYQLPFKDIALTRLVLPDVRDDVQEVKHIGAALLSFLGIGDNSNRILEWLKRECTGVTDISSTKAVENLQRQTKDLV